MYTVTAKEWITEMQAAGKLGGLDGEALEKLTKEYAEKIEEYFHAAITKQLEPVGKAAEFERMMLYDGQYMNKYLNQTIPGYPAFKMDILSKAKKDLTSL